MKGIAHDVVSGELDKEIRQITADSRVVEEDMLFVALRGTVTDGHDFIDMAIEKGATAILCEEVPQERKKGITYLQIGRASCRERV